MHTQRSLGILLVCLLTAPLWAQEIDVNRSNRTIAVKVDEIVAADADAATLNFAVVNQADSSEEVYNENVRLSAAIIAAMMQMGIAKEDIETRVIKLEILTDENRTPVGRKTPHFQARQEWSVRVLASGAQNVIDAVVHAGVNEIEGVTWRVQDPAALEAEAGKRAFARAKALAENMARELGVKMGALVYASNSDEKRLVEQFWMRREVRYPTVRQVSLKLFPEKVKQQATVRAVFAIE